MTPDAINGGFEFISACLGVLNIRAILRAKRVEGVSLAPSVFFTAWAYWNLFYYPSLGQWFSFAGGVCLAAVLTAWLALAVRYRSAA